jgi:hypothetical protein
MTANVSVSNTTGLYIGSGASSVLNSAQQLLTILDNNGNVNFALDSTTSNTQVKAYFVGAFPPTYSNANVASFLPTYGGVINSGTIFNDSGFAIQGRDYTQMQYTNGVTPPVSEYDIGVGAWFYIDAGGGVFQSNTTGNLKTITYGHDATINAGGNITAPYFLGDGSLLTNLPTGSIYGNANVAAYLPTDANIRAIWSNIQITNANLGAFETWANSSIQTTNANLGAYQIYANANAATQSISIQTTNANLGAFETYANATFGTSSYGNTQAAAWIQIDPTVQAINANLGAFETYANATFVTSASSYGNANVAAYLPTYTGNLIPGNVSIPYTSGLRNRGPLAVGGTLNHSDTGVVASFQGNEPTYLYTSLQNTNTGNTAYSSYAVNDATHTYYGELGINSGTYDYAAAGYPDNAFSKPYATFIQSTGANLAIGTYGNFGINFVVNGGTVAADAMTITNTGNVTMSSNVVAVGSIAAASLITTSGVYWANGAAYSSYGNAQVASYIYDNGVSVGTSGTAVISSSNSADVNDASTGPTTGSFVLVGGGSIGKSVKIFGNANIGNIISTGTTTLKAATISTTLGVTGNITAGNVSATYFVGDGSKLTNIASTYGNTQVAAFLPTYTGNLNGVLTSGNVYAPNVSITNTSGLTASSVTVQGGNGNASVIGGNYLNLIGGNGVTINQQGAPVQIIGANLALYSNAYGGGLITTGNLVTTSGVYWANGAVYSTGSSFTGNLAGSVLSDGVNQRILANAYPFSTPASTTNSNYVNFVTTAPTYTAGVLQAPASATTGFATTLVTSANLGLQSSYQTSTNRTTLGSMYYTQLTPVTANIMTLQDRVRGVISSTDVMLSGKTWGIMSSSSLFNTSVMGQSNQLQIIGTGEVAPAVGMQGLVTVIPTGGSANVQYAAGVHSFVSYTAGAGATTSNIAYARLYTGQVSGANGTTLNITNAIGLHTPSGWAGSAVNKYALLNEDATTSITTLGNIYAQGNITTSGGWMLAGAAFTANSVSGLTFFGTAAGAGSTTFLSPVTLSNTISGTGTISTSGNIGTTGNTILKGFTETVVAKGNSTGTVTVDANAGTVQTLTLTGSITINAANLSNFGLGRSVTLVLTQGGTGSYTLTSNMKFAGASSTLSTAVGAIDVINIFFDGTNYLASLVKGYA